MLFRSKNKANPQVMQKISLAGGSPNTFKPTAANLKSKVLECALSGLQINRATDHDFAFNSVAASVDNLAESLEKAAARHPKTKGKEIAVVLRDPVGIATELNELRLRRHELAKAEMEKPENLHPLNSSNALLGLKQSIIDVELLDSYKVVSPPKFKKAFEEARHLLPPGTEWHPASNEERQDFKAMSSMAWWKTDEVGRIVYPDHDARAATWARQQAEKTWVKLAPHYDEGARAAWVAAFEARIKSQHYEPLAKYEDDWLAATQDAKTLDYFARHFDANDSNSPLNLLCSGKVYASESQFIHQPAPLTSGAVLDLYLAMLDKPITDEAAVVQRALVGNQKEVIAVIHEQVTGDANSTGMRDENYEFMKGVLGLDGSKRVLNKYGWIGDTVSMFSVGQLTAMSGALMSMIGRSPAVGAALSAQLGRVQSLWCVQQAVEYAASSALQGTAPKMPVLLSMRVDAKAALEVIRARPGQNLGISKSRIKRQGRAGGTITLTQLTDTDALKATHGDAKKLLQNPAYGGVQMGAGANAAIAASTGAVLSEQQFLRLYATQAARGARAVNAVRESLGRSLQTGSGGQMRALSMSLEGRLAIGAVVVQGIGLVHGLNKLETARTDKELRDAWYGFYDSNAGLLAGVLEVWAVAAQASIVAKAGEIAAKKSLGLAALRFAANMAGAAGGVMMMITSWAKAKDAGQAGDVRVQNFYKLSGVAFGGTIATSTTLAFTGLAGTLAKRGVGGLAARAALGRIAAVGAAEILGLSLTGWGLVLLGGAVIFHVSAAALTPTPMQRWMSRSYFGKDPSWFDWDGKREDMFKQGDWKAEFVALEEAIKEATGASEQPKKADPKNQAAVAG